MNLCCSPSLTKEDLGKYDEIIIKVKESKKDERKDDKIINGKLIFNHPLGLYYYKNINSENESNNEIEKYQKILEEKKNEKDDYIKKIKDLDKKIKNMEKLLIMDIKEKEYIKLIGEKTQEENNKENDE